MLEMFDETNSLGKFMRTVVSKVTAFLVDETIVMLLCYVLGNIFFLEIPERLFGR